MPRFDKTGPWGRGPHAGRGLRRCARKGFGWQGRLGRAFGWRWGGGPRRQRCRWWGGQEGGAPLEEDRRRLLEEEAQALRERLREIEEELGERK